MNAAVRRVADAARLTGKLAPLVRRTRRAASKLWREMRWAFRRFTDRRYRHHIVYTELDADWYDCGEVLLYASMAVLCRYVEWEQGGVDLGTGRFIKPITVQCDSDNEAIALYRWWRVERPAALAEIHLVLLDESRWRELHVKEEELTAAETDAICRLARIRGALWT